MLQRFLQLIGIHEDVLRHLDRAELLWQRSEVLWIGLVVLLPLAFMVYRRQKLNLHTVPKWLLLTLCLTRVSILALLFVILSGPYLRIDHKFERKPIVAFVFDHSQSMRLPAGPFETDEQFAEVAKAAGYVTDAGQQYKPAAQASDSVANATNESTVVDPEARKALNRITRADLSQTAVRVAAPDLLKPLEGKFDVRHFAFAREPVQFVFDASKIDSQLPDSGGGVSTWIGSAVQLIVDDAAGQTISGIVLFSDGQNTGGRSP
ncbi:MAG TPA: hypothetical protein VK137_15545, partial [Planctomycetaceae bacterium]|nr:hypothetical protein [Planctomycetaceae bacterium]